MNQKWCPYCSKDSDINALVTLCERNIKKGEEEREVERKPTAARQ
jgi:hypothetical protein